MMTAHPVNPSALLTFGRSRAKKLDRVRILQALHFLVVQPTQQSIEKVNYTVIKTDMVIQFMIS